VEAVGAPGEHSQIEINLSERAHTGTAWGGIAAHLSYWSSEKTS